MENKSSSNGISLVGVLLIVFVVLKLTGNLDWSWWWVLSPIWIPFAILASIFVFAFIAVIILLIFGFSTDDIKNMFGNSDK